MTNFSELKQNNPIAFRLFEQWCEKRFGTCLVLFCEKINNEDIVLFLDERGLFTNVNTLPTISSASISQEVRGMTTTFGLGVPFKTRTEATEEVIKKAFGLLEDKLKKN